VELSQTISFIVVKRDEKLTVKKYTMAINEVRPAKPMN
jgi:hypothetical protein